MSLLKYIRSLLIHKPAKVLMPFFCFWMIMLVNGANAQSESTTERQVKAVFLYNFTQFVEWPAASFVETGSPLVIGVLGENSIEPYLEQVVRDETVKGHPLVVRHFKNVEAVRDCHVLFIPDNENQQVMEALNLLKGQDVLTISDSAGFTRQGGMIRFYKEENKIRLEVNLEAVQASGLQISSKLLRVAKIYKPDKT